MRGKKVKLLRKAFREKGISIEADCVAAPGIQRRVSKGRRTYQLAKLEVR